MKQIANNAGISHVPKFGSGAAAEGLPEWFPAYPGANVQGNYSSQGKDGYSGGFQFTTQDPVESVVKFYEDSLRQAGFRMTSSLSKQDAKVTGGLASGEDAAAKRTALVNDASSDDGTQVSVYAYFEVEVLAGVSTCRNTESARSN